MQDVATAKACTRCQRVKPFEAFYKNGRKGKEHSWCKVCCNSYRAVVARQEKEKRRAWYRANAERLRQQKRTERHRAICRRYRQSLLGRLRQARASARYRLRRGLVKTPGGIARCKRLIDTYNREIRKLQGNAGCGA